MFGCFPYPAFQNTRARPVYFLRTGALPRLPAATDSVTAPRHVHLHVASGDRHWRDVERIGRVGADQHQRVVIGIINAQIITVRPLSWLTMIFATGIEQNKTIISMVPSNARQSPNSLEIDVIERGPRRAGTARITGDVPARDHLHIQSLEVQPRRMIHIVPIAATGCVGVAARVDHPAEAVLRLAVAPYTDRAAPRQPAQIICRWRWRDTRLV